MPLNFVASNHASKSSDVLVGTSLTVYHHNQLTYPMVHLPEQKSNLGIPSEIPSICKSARRYASSCQILPGMYLVDYIHTMINDMRFYCYKSSTYTSRSLPLYGERAFYPVVFKRINDFQKKIHHQIYHQDVVAYQFQTLPDSARKIVF